MFREDQPLFKDMAEIIFEIFDNMDPATSPGSMTEIVLNALGDRVGFLSETTLNSLGGITSEIFAAVIRHEGAVSLILDQAPSNDRSNIVPFGVVFSGSEEALLEKVAEIHALAKSLNFVDMQSNLPPRVYN